MATLAEVIVVADHRKPENMSAETIYGVRIGLALAVELIDRECAKVLADGTTKRGHVRVMESIRASYLNELGTRIFAIRDQYVPATDKARAAISAALGEHEGG